MNLVRTVKDLQSHIEKMHLSPLGFVPTMGALHDGHISLVLNAVNHCPIVAVSIFVNPNQFNNKDDLKNYPRNIDKDLNLLGKVLREHDIVFVPDKNEIYPEEDKRVFSFGNLDKVMEGQFRPGFFNGVAQVVSRLFEIVKPDSAYFGQKDFQQLCMIKQLVKQTGDKVKIVANPIIRESDGLAMSSRNQLLEPEIRKKAGVIYKTISAASLMISDHDIDFIKNYVKETIDRNPDFRTEYFEIADDIELITLVNKTDYRKGRRYFGCIAVWAGKVRLIDNIPFSLT
jgi:pantoate--beta-alanine ligase